MARGRKPKPTEMKRRAGNPGHHPLNANEPKLEAKLPPFPAYLQGEAASAWNTYADKLNRAGILTEIDGIGLELLCSAYEDWYIARSMVKKEGALLRPPVQGKEIETLWGKQLPDVPTAQMVHNPWLGIMRNREQAILKLLPEYGMTPSSRSRISAPPDEKDDLTQFIEGEGAEETNTVQ